MKKMMSVVLSTGFFAIGAQSFASTDAETLISSAPAKFRCSNVGDNEEWVINVDLEKRKASFFDNDGTVLVDLVGIEGLESINAPVNYVFEGEDTHSTPGDRLRITFAMEPFLTQAPTASLTLELGKPSQYSLDASACVEDDSVNL